jgi:hypothetical protein
MMPHLQRRVRGHSAKILIVFMLAMPALVGLVRKDALPIENRVPALFPSRPDSWNALLRYPAMLDLWINDHFGFRRQLVKLNNRVRYHLFGQFPTRQVVAGRNGRIFLAAHATSHPPYSAILLSCGAHANDMSPIAAQLNRFSAAYDKLGIDAKIMIAPSAPAVYPEDLPAWLAAQCDPVSAPIPRVLAAPLLAPDAQARAYFPMETMRRLEPGEHAIPKTWFHWAGAGPRAVAQESVRRFWPTRAAPAPAPLASRTASKDSDIAHLFEGVRLASEVEETDYAASGIDACDRPQCFPELGRIAEKLGDVSRYRNDRAQAGRLVLFSDSYGHYIAGGYSPFFREVVHFSTNNFGLLSADDMAALRQMFLQRAADQQVLFVYHDVSVLWGRIEADQKKLLP